MKFLEWVERNADLVIFLAILVTLAGGVTLASLLSPEACG